MKIKLYNSLSRQIEVFVPQKKDQVSIYSCGPTVYYYPHIGNWASYIYWDILVRVFLVNGYEVTRAMNITDVGHLTSDSDEGEDKLTVRSQQEGKNAWEIARFYTDNFLVGMKKLNLIMPKYIARATDFIPRQLDMVKELKQKGLVYQTSDGIYFDTSKFPNYNKLSGVDLESLKNGARIGINKEKKNPTDFAVWKFSPQGRNRDMEWPTPNEILDNPSDQIIMGFPGWHIECSAIARNFLGKTLDIHTGGIDHIPIHHTNEIAQSESVNEVKFCNYWLHNNFLKSNNQKISKSLNNGYRLEELEERGFQPVDLRMFVIQGSYHSEGNFTFESLEAAANRLRNWRNTACLRHQIHGKYQESINIQQPEIGITTACRAIIEAVSHDLDTPKALKLIDDIFDRITNSPLDNINYDSFTYLLETIDNLLGLNLITSTPDITDDLKKIIVQRNLARQQKDWEKADQLRDQLDQSNIVINDKSTSSTWQYKN